MENNYRPSSNSLIKRESVTEQREAMDETEREKKRQENQMGIFNNR